MHLPAGCRCADGWRRLPTSSGRWTGRQKAASSQRPSRRARHRREWRPSHRRSNAIPKMTEVRLKRIFSAMRFEWDDTKSGRALSERGSGFDYAARIFLGPTLEKEDTRRYYGEVRMQAIGQAGDDVLFVVYTDRGDIRHIISARLASRKERRSWRSFAEQWKTSGG
jgi:uncharacterized DUF497 family protein